MATERQFAEELTNDYVRQGWQKVDPREAEGRLGFQPDLLFTRDNEYLVVEIRHLGMPRTSVPEVRKKVQKIPNWRFELKLLPPEKEYVTTNIADAETPNRLILSENLLKQGQYSNAALIASVAVETSLRKLTWGENLDKQPASVPDLLRDAFESEKITDLELRKLQKINQLRNQIVHGYAVQVSEADAKLVVSMARELTDRNKVPSE